MTFRTSWGISFHEYLVPLFSARISRHIQPHPVDPEGSHPVETEGPHPFESRKDPIGRNRTTLIWAIPTATEQGLTASGRNSSGSGSHQGRRTRRTSSGDPERPSSGRPRSHPRKVRPYPVETQVDPGRIRVGDPERPSSWRPRPYPSKVQPYPAETQVDPGRIRVVDPDWPSSGRPRPDRIRINRPGRIRGNSGKLRHIQVNSG